MTTAIAIPSNIYYERTLFTYFGWHPQSIRDILWQRFALSEGYTASSPPTDSLELQQAFNSFLLQYKEWSLTDTSLTLNNPIPTANPYYNIVLNNYFPNTSSLQKQDIWNGFVDSQNMKTNPPDTAQIREAFSAFVRILSDDFVSQTLSDYFGTRPISLRMSLWERFTAIKGSNSLSLADTSQNESDFSDFVKRYNALALDATLDQVDEPIPTTSPLYMNLLNAYFGNLSNIEQQDIWNSFLAKNGYSSTPSDSFDVQQRFSNYIQGLLSRLYNFESVTALTPDEMKSRLILSSITQNLKSFLNATEQLINVESAALIFYGNVQQIYTNMMTRVPNLTGGVQPTVATSNSSLDDFTFGYNDISLTEVIQWGVDQALSNPGTTFTFGNTTKQAINQSDYNGALYNIFLGQYSFTINTAANGVQTLTIIAQEDVTPSNLTSSVTIQDPTANPTVNLDFSDICTQAENAYLSLFTANPGFLQQINGQPAIPGRYLGIQNPSGDAQIGENTLEMTNRAERNAALQQYVENTRSYRDSVDTKTDELQTLLNQTRDSINEQTSLWTTILETLDEIIQAINNRQ